MRIIKDKHGNEVREGDVLKVLHFVGARNKKHYMYKLVTIVIGELFGLHLGKNTLKPVSPERGYPEGYFLRWHVHHSLDVNAPIEPAMDIEIVEDGDCDPERKLKGPAA